MSIKWLADDDFMFLLTVLPLVSYGFLRLPVLQRYSRRKRLLFRCTSGICVLYFFKIWFVISWISILEVVVEVRQVLVGVLFIAFLSVLFIAFLSLCYVLVRVWVSSLSQSAQMQDDQPTRVKSISYHAEKPWMIISFSSGHVAIWKQDKSHRFAVSPGFMVRASAFLRDDIWVAASDDNQIRAFNHDGKLVHKFQAHDDYIRSLEVHPTRPYLLSASDDMKVRLWDIEYNYECIRTFQGHMHYVMQVRLNPNNTNEFATASLDRTIKFWSLEESEPLFSLEGHERGVNSIDFLKGSDTLIVSGSDDQTVKVWNYQTRQLLHTLSGHTDNVTAVLFHTQSMIVSISEDCSVRFWNYIANTDSSKSGELLTLQYKALGRGWALAAATCNKDQIAVGFDQACLTLDVARDKDKNTLEITKEQNISNQVLGHEHIPVVVVNAVADDSLLPPSSAV
jgi:WD40 repeat protein